MTTLTCPVHKVPMILKDHCDDGDIGGIQYWDDFYTCPIDGCDEDDWVSWREDSREKKQE